MKKKAPWRILPVFMGILTFAAFVGSLSGSIAWWAYSTRASVSYHGTAVLSSQQLQAGIKVKTADPYWTGQKLTDLEDFVTNNQLTPFVDGDYTYYFAETSGGLSSDTIKAYLELENKYAVDKLTPITSGAHANGSDLALKEPILFGHAMNNDPAATSKYCKLSLGFRILHTDSILGNAYAPDEPIWIMNTQALASSAEDGKINEALRIYIEGVDENDDELKFILNPTSTYSKTQTALMKTKVGGFLNLDAKMDSYYDTQTVIKGGVPVEEEIPYGEFISALPESTEVAVEDFDNPNGVSDTSTPTTFYAKHKAGAYYFDSFTPAVQEYRTIDCIKPNDTEAAVLEGGVPVTYTSNDAKAIADIDLTIWLEGWDHSCVDQEVSHSFSLDLLFQINLAD